MKVLLSTICTIILLVTSVNATAKMYEKDYQKIWCDAHNGQMEVVLSDRTRVDCVTDEFAVEVDWAYKWEPIQQSLWYAMNTGKRAAILLIVGPGEENYVKRVSAIIAHYPLPITLFTIEKQ